MKIRDIPVVILAAGLSKRFHTEHRIVPKSLLKIDSHHTIFDIIINGLESNRVSEVQLILGYKSEEFKQYLENQSIKRKGIRIKSIQSGKNYINGPIFSLLSLLPHISPSWDRFIVIPSDTIFHPSLLNQLFALDLSQISNKCLIFTIQLSKEILSRYSTQISFSPNYIDDNSIFNSLIAEKIPNYDQIILIPMVILTRNFLEFVNITENRISEKIISNLEIYYKKTHLCSQISLRYEDSIPPFIDIDTSHTYNTLHSVKKELFESYKVK